MSGKTPLAASQTYLSLFSNLSEVIAQTTDLSNLLRSSVQVIQGVLLVDSCSIMLLNNEKTLLNLMASSSIPENLWSRICVKLGEGVAGKVAATGEPIVISGFGEPEKHHHASGRDYQTKSFISIPLQSGQTTLGVINVTDRVDRSEFTPFDLEMLQAVSKLIACAINNHRQWVRTQRSHEHLAMVIEELPIGMLSITASGSLTLCNKSARQYLNAEGEIELEIPWERYFGEPVRSHIAAMMAKIAQGRTSDIDEFEITDSPSHPPRSVRICAVVADYLHAVNTRRILFFVEDVQQAKELVDLRRSDQMKSNFLSLISHELRTPLASIKGAIHLLNQMDPNEIQENGERIFSLLHRNIDRLTSLVNNILDAMDLDTQSLRLYRKRTDLHALVDKIVSKMMNLSAEKSLCWHVDLEDSSQGVYVDESRLSQVVEHLFENALKFTPTQGKICVEARSQNGTWSLRVSNTGRCIESSLHEKIFSRFYQVDGTLTRYYGGSGLGLYLCREIIRLHGGEIRIDPRFSDGACFEVSLPEVTELA